MLILAYKLTSSNIVRENANPGAGDGSGLVLVSLAELAMLQNPSGVKGEGDSSTLCRFAALTLKNSFDSIITSPYTIHYTLNFNPCPASGEKHIFITFFAFLLEKELSFRVEVPAIFQFVSVEDTLFVFVQFSVYVS